MRSVSYGVYSQIKRCTLKVVKKKVWDVKSEHSVAVGRFAANLALPMDRCPRQRHGDNPYGMQEMPCQSKAVPSRRAGAGLVERPLLRLHGRPGDSRHAKVAFVPRRYGVSRESGNGHNNGVPTVPCPGSAAPDSEHLISFYSHGVILPYLLLLPSATCWLS
jgi:hypothetical protein